MSETALGLWIVVAILVGLSLLVGAVVGMVALLR